MNLENQTCDYLNGWAHAQIHENTLRIIIYNVKCYFSKNLYDVILLNNSGNAGFFNGGRGGGLKIKNA